MTIQTKVNWLIVVVVVLIVLVVWLLVTRPKPVASSGATSGADYTELHDYLGETASNLRKALSDMNCSIYMLGEHPTVQHPYNTQTRPNPCPPGGPSLVPKDPP